MVQACGIEFRVSSDAVALLLQPPHFPRAHGGTIDAGLNLLLEGHALAIGTIISAPLALGY